MIDRCVRFRFGRLVGIVAAHGGFCLPADLSTDDIRLDSIDFVRLVASAKLLEQVAAADALQAEGQLRSRLVCVCVVVLASHLASQLHTGGHAEFGEDVGEVGLHRPR